MERFENKTKPDRIEDPADKKEFIDHVLSLVKIFLKHETMGMEIDDCPRFSEQELRAFVYGEISSEKMEEFEKHANQCLSCAKRLLKLHEDFISEKRTKLEKSFINRTIRLLDQLDKSGK